jgi:hypothetical protein
MSGFSIKNGSAMFYSPNEGCWVEHNLGNCEAQKSQPPVCKQTLQEKIGTPCEKEDTMHANANYAIATAMNSNTTADKQRGYFVDRLYALKSEKLDELWKQFGMSDLDLPKTPAEFVDLVKTGKYYFRKPDQEATQYEPAVYYERVSSYIRFRDPLVKKDDAGYERALKALNVAHENARDKLWAEQDSLKVLEDFRNWKYLNS